MKKIIIYPVYFILFTIIACCRRDDPTIDPTEEVSSSEAILQPNNGGSTFPNQVYIDLSTLKQTEVLRTSWDLGFYSGADFSVILNGSIKMAAKQLSATDIDQVQVVDENVTVGNFKDSNSANYVDNPSGNINKTFITAITANDTDNKVYLLNLGKGIAEGSAAANKTNIEGELRGWKKIRILRSGNDYKLQYADLEATTHQEVIISKNKAYNFSFFSFNTDSTVIVEPQKDQWDINMTTFTNTIPYTGYDISYFFSDFVVINSRAGVTAYQVLTAEGGSYEAFALANVDQSKFEIAAAKDQRAIGSNWRVTTTNPPSVYDDRFFILKDTAGNIYKIKFIAMVSATGERGNITFQYELLK